MYFIGDLHFGHKNICQYRTKFKTPVEHDEYIVKQWNLKVTSKRDIVWVLGDMCIQNPNYDMGSIINRLNGTIWLIPGNHDYIPYYNHPKITIKNTICKKYGFWITHIPIHPTELYGKKNIHGHVHIIREDIGDNYINVTCEHINYTPVSLDDIRLVYK